MRFFHLPALQQEVIAWLRSVPYVMHPLGTLTVYGMTQRAPLKRASLALIERPLLRRAAAVHFTSDEELSEARILNLAMYSTIISLGGRRKVNLA